MTTKPNTLNENDYLHIFGISHHKGIYTLVVCRQYIKRGLYEFSGIKRFKGIQEIGKWINKLDPLARVAIVDSGNILTDAIKAIRTGLTNLDDSEDQLTISVDFSEKKNSMATQSVLLSKFDEMKSLGILKYGKQIAETIPAYNIDVDERHNKIPYYEGEVETLFKACLVCLSDFELSRERFESSSVFDLARDGYLYRRDQKENSHEYGSSEWDMAFFDELDRLHSSP